MISLKNVSLVKAIGRTILALTVSLLLGIVFYLNPVTHVTENYDKNACRPGPTNNWCAPEVSYTALSAKKRLEDSGLKCNEKPNLSDFVIFEYKGGGVEAVTFDNAFEKGQDSEGWSRFFCDK